MRPLLDLVRVMTVAERRRLALLALGLSLAAGLEMAGVASIVPFLTLVGDPAATGRLPALAALRDRLGLDERGFLMLAGAASLAAILATSAANGLLALAQLRFTNLTGYALSRRLLASYLAQDRAFFARRNSAELAKNVLAEADRLVSGVLTPVTTLVARSLAALAIVVFLILYEPLLALLLGAGFGGVYVAIYAVMRRRLSRLGAAASADNEARFRIVAECFAALTELKLYGRAEAFSARYAGPARAYAAANATGLLLGQVPRFVIEALAFGGIVGVVLYGLARGLDTAGLLPLLGLFAFAGYRLLPAFQNVFLAVSTVRYNLPAARIVVEGLSAPVAARPRTAERLPFSREIRFEGVSFAHEGAGRPVLDRIDLVVPARTRIGLVGGTGSGKSTLAGLLLGILSPTAGRITVDGVALDAATLGAWQNRIGYVPQDVVLVDGSVAQNIALGVPEGEIDREAVRRAARIARVDAVVAALPGGYDAPVGERGARLSGGQRQRLGIARALYHDPDVLVFDEATSALDGETEAAVVDAIEALGSTRTILLIAHRPTALRRVETVHLLEEGRLVRSGPPADLLPTLGAAA